MKTILIIFQIFLAILLSVLIFLQTTGEGEGRNNILTPVNFAKRGWEKVVFIFTLVILVIFIISSIIQAAI